MLILTSIPIVQQVLLPAPVIPAPISDSALLPSLAALLPSIVTPLPSTALLTCSALLGTALAIAVLVPIFGEESRYSERGWHRLGHGRPEIVKGYFHSHKDEKLIFKEHLKSAESDEMPEHFSV
ncbi:hypothetical protein UY3_15313 [Chelonia mydas]|uniref:Uncharacterized protein n=1 Tax=Chelonia mydas TaxID=8469 RepID=M7AX32_CHEMY|nr:hypothetical protein UY3_15313 [Chelonia mydas]